MPMVFHQRKLHNIQKCLTAGYDEVWAISDDEAHLAKLEDLVAKNLDPEAGSRVHFLSPDGAMERLGALPQPPAHANENILGYEVLVVPHSLPLDERRLRRERLRQLLDGGIRS